jgi:hypothetical protein
MQIGVESVESVEYMEYMEYVESTGVFHVSFLFHDPLVESFMAS